MARPRTPSNVLELRGAFKNHPARKRKDAEGAGPFDQAPPTHLPAAIAPAWKYLVARLPKAALTSSDEVAVEAAAWCLAGVWQLADMGGPINPGFLKLAAELRQWLGKLGMTPVDRTRIAAPEAPSSGNQFADV